MPLNGWNGMLQLQLRSNVLDLGRFTVSRRRAMLLAFPITIVT